MELKNLSIKEIFNVSVIIAALGYFVDVYDLLLFLVVKTQSLTEIGIASADITNEYIKIHNMQMMGMLLGGILWGILGDKKGRLSVLFGSIFLYSAANFANAFVQNVEMYGWLRFIAGVGLAGELGAGITQVSEVMSKENRGIGTMLVASIGVLGAILAGLVANYLDWRVCYMIGGVLGFALLLLRIGVVESGMFAKVKTEQHISRGNFLSLFTNGKRFTKYMKCIMVGVPIWYVISVLIGLAKQFGAEFNVIGEVKDNFAVLFCYAGLTVGDVLAGVLSQILKSRKKVLFIFINLSAILCAVYFSLDHVSYTVMYTMCFLLGLSVGYWAIFITIAAEQFGTNIRATAATTVPNFVRGASVPIMLSFKYLKGDGGMAMVPAAITVGVVCLIIAYIALFNMEETFGKELDYNEEA